MSFLTSKNESAAFTERGKLIGDGPMCMGSRDGAEGLGDLAGIRIRDRFGMQPICGGVIGYLTFGVVPGSRTLGQPAVRQCQSQQLCPIPSGRFKALTGPKARAHALDDTCH